jgi:hypothetical protein
MPNGTWDAEEIDELREESERRLKLLRWAYPYLENWLLYLEDNTAKDVDDLVELMEKTQKEVSDGLS